MKSMTAYANISKKINSESLQIILRSLNFKYLDISINSNLAENILLEEKIKEEVRKIISRGKIEIYIYFKKYFKTIEINKEVLTKYISNIKNLAKECKLECDLKLNNFLDLPGVISSKEKEINQKTLVLSVLREGLKMLLKFKEKAGEKIKCQMLNNLKKLKLNISKIKNLYKLKKINEKKEIVNNKTDIEEEISLTLFYIDRLEKDINSKRDIPKGKIIDFLTQEILRELNTASSKTTDKTFAYLILESKIYVDRIREQAQNIE